MHFEFSQWWLVVIPFICGLFTKRGNLDKAYGSLLVLSFLLVSPYLVANAPDLQHMGWLGYVVACIICFLYISFWMAIPVGLRALVRSMTATKPTTPVTPKTP
jgi:hypothetical protein